VSAGVTKGVRLRTFPEGNSTKGLILRNKTMQSQGSTLEYNLQIVLRNAILQSAFVIIESNWKFKMRDYRLRITDFGLRIVDCLDEMGVE
jgi:hypothetical protein